MINLIGSELNYDWLKLPLVHLHWYDKAVRPGRKVGHLNLTDSDTSRLSATPKRSLRSCRANTPAALSGRKVSLNKQRGRRILSPPVAITESRFPLCPPSSIRDNAPIHAGFPHRFTYPLTAVTFGPIAPSALANGASSSGEA